jgi:zinc protease
VKNRFDLPAVGAASLVAFPAAVRSALRNGLAVQAIEWPAVPAVSVALVLPRGGAADPPHHPGRMGLVADLLDEGAGTRDTIELAEAFAAIGAHLDVDLGPDVTTFSLTTLTRHLPVALSLLSDVVLGPHLDAAGLARVRELRQSRLRQLARTPAAPADRGLLAAIFGTHPYGHGVLGTSKALENITLEDVRATWSEQFTLTGATVILAGAMTAEDAVAAVARSPLGSAQAHTAASTGSTTAEPLPPGGRKVWLIERAGVPQSEIRVGQQGPSRRIADYHALVTLNALLGGQFTSRINRNLRETRGITYGARTAFEFRRDGGTFECAASVQADATVDAVREVLREIAGVREDGAIEPAEISRAKASLTRGYARGFETARQLVRAAAHLVVHRLPDDTFDQFVPMIEALPEAELTAAATTYLDPEACAIVVVGDPAHSNGLREFGAVEVVDPEF